MGEAGVLREKGEATSQVCLTSEGSGWLLPHIPDHGQTAWMRHDGEHMPTRAQGVTLHHLGCGAGRGETLRSTLLEI